MRLTLVAPVLVTALASCVSKPLATPPPSGEDRDIEIVLAKNGTRCVVNFEDRTLKDPDHAIAWTKHKVVWLVTRNDCGELKKTHDKALGLKYLRLKSNGQQPPWFDSCKPLDEVPATGNVFFKCHIPSSTTGNWEGVYEYEIDGDDVEPGDPDIRIRRNG